MIDITTDSCADLSKELISSRSIRVIPLQVFIENQNLKDGEISTQELFNRVEASGSLPKTAAPSVAEFARFFETPGETIFIGISSKLSATVPNSLLSLDLINPDKNVYILDSLNLSIGIGLLVLKAADLRDQGYSAVEIVETLRQLTPKVRTSFIIDTMEYLYKGGRCTALQAIFGSVLKIRPVIEVREDGTLGVKDKLRGGRQKGLKSLLDDFISHLDEMDLKRVFITHTGCDQDAAYLAQEIRKSSPVEEVLITTAGATISSHCGPNTIGILYMVK
ncbi:MAG: DegV family protein [Bellilinea sp.]|jgi:DegV family protein with EDD domain